MHIRPDIIALLPDLIEVRRYLHSHPELSLKEFETARYLRAYLKSLGYTTADEGTGFWVDVEGADKSRLIGLRADTDALPILEAVEVDYKSQNEGVMHACGHDGHAATLAIFAKYLTTHKPAVSLRLVFQPGEEGFGGANFLINAGAAKGVDEFYALHVAPGLPVGRFTTRSGVNYAGMSEVYISVTGKQAHCSQPAKGIDALAAAAEIISHRAQINENLPDTLFHFGKLVSGTAANIVAGSAEIVGTMRFFDMQSRHTMIERLEKALAAVDEKYGSTSVLRLGCTYRPLSNSPTAVDKIKKILGEDVEEGQRTYGAEDFSDFIYAAEANGGHGAMASIGTADERYSSPVHTNTFGFNEAALLYGVEFFARVGEGEYVAGVTGICAERIADSLRG